jgi:hypothetical protein
MTLAADNAEIGTGARRERTTGHSGFSAARQV